MIVENLKFLRKNKHFTQAEMLDFIDIKGNTKWSDYERGKSTPPLEILLIISDKFKISLDDLTKSDLSNTHILEKEGEGKTQGNTHKNHHIYTHISPQTEANASVVAVVCSNCQQLQNIVVEKDKLIQSQQQTIQSQQQTVQALQLATTQLQQRLNESIMYVKEAEKRGATAKPVIT